MCTDGSRAEGTFQIHHNSAQRYTNPRRQVAWKTKFSMAVRNICASSVRNLLHVTLPAPSFETTPRFVKNLYTPGLTPSNCCSITKADTEWWFRLLEKLIWRWFK